MSDIAIKVENLSKQYRLGQVGTGTISHDLNRWWHQIRGKEDPYLKIGESNDRTKSGDSNYVWALEDINFEVKQGEVLGIIGKNGAGKSTLLKVLSKVTGPTTGSIKARGRIASLLEVGTGFHPEMTGRENIFMNGTIMGMTRHEVAAKLDEIVEFAGIARYLDTPVKRYSSGMTVRLGFSIAAHLEPEILIVDEVLAVGDAEFQKKAIGKMKDVSQGQGRTVLFVSHNMASINKLCNSGLLLKDGTVHYSGQISEVINQYTALNQYTTDTKIDQSQLKNSKIDGFEIIDVKLDNSNIRTGGELEVIIKYKSDKKFISPTFVISIKTLEELELIRLSNMPISGMVIEDLYDSGIVKLSIKDLPLVKGTYIMDIGFVRQNVEWYFNLKNIITFEVEGYDVYNSGFILDRTRGILSVSHNWNHEML